MKILVYSFVKFATTNAAAAVATAADEEMPCVWYDEPVGKRLQGYRGEVEGVEGKAAEARRRSPRARRRTGGTGRARRRFPWRLHVVSALLRES